MIARHPTTDLDEQRFARILGSPELIGEGLRTSAKLVVRCDPAVQFRPELGVLDPRALQLLLESVGACDGCVQIVAIRDVIKLGRAP